MIDEDKNTALTMFYNQTKEMRLKGKSFFDENYYDFTIEFCEQHDLCGLFIDCKFNPTVLYVFAKYKAECKDIEWLEKAIDKINELHKKTTNKTFLQRIDEGIKAHL